MFGEVVVVSKVEIPNYVAEYIEDCKDRDITLYSALNYLRSDHFELKAEEDLIDKVTDWLWDGSGDVSFRKFARAWLDGYHVEAEKTFKLRLKSKVVTPRENYLNKNLRTGEYFIHDDTDSDVFQTLFTEEDVKDLDLTGFVRELQLPF